MRTPAKLRILAGAACAVMMLAGCAGNPAPEPVPAEPQAPVPEAKPPTVYRPFPQDTLYALLVAELAARRGGLDVALENYLRQARTTRDPGVAAQAARIARYLEADAAALEASLLWAEVDPRNPDARAAAASELARAGRPREAFTQMLELQRLGGTAGFAAVAAGALESPEAERQAMLAEIEAVGEAGGNDALIARALLLQSMGRNDEALAATAQVLELEPDNAQAILVEAQVFQNLGETDKAHARIERALAEEPGNSRLRLQYARMLSKTDLKRAEQQFRVLVDDAPDDAELRLSLALVYRETHQYERMRAELETLVASGGQQSAARFYLGEDDERREQVEAAITQYREVAPSPLFPVALTRLGELILASRGTAALGMEMAGLRARWPEHALRILLLESELRVEKGDLDGAWALLSGALLTQPGEPTLLYARSMVSEKRRDVPALERDLREILRLDPESALALNALGYSLTNLTDRHREALTLIERALELKPGDPAILDSLGWVHYRLGDRERAIGYLQEAFGRFPDHEVAAHLGEVLWTMGRTDEARAIWGKGLEGTPDSALINEAMRRLGAAPP